MKQGWIFLLAAMFATACGQNSDDKSERIEQDETAYVRVLKSDVTPQFMMQTGFNPDHKQDDVFAFGYLSRDRLESLPSEIAENTIELDERFSRINFDAKTLNFDTDALKSLDELREGYHDYSAMTEELSRLADEFPGHTELFSAGQSVQDRELWVMKISDNASEDENEPKLLYIANMHGDETVGRELMIYLIRHLVEAYATDTRVQALVNNAQIYIMPSMNPDGFERGRRSNTNGSDLNRNFPDFVSDPRDTPTGRQPETKAVMRLHAQHHFVQAINFHGGAVCFNLPWDTKANSSETERFGDDPLLSVLGREYADTNTHMSSNGGFDRGVTYGYEWYRVAGGLQDWANYYRRSMHATIELSFTKYPSASTLDTHWERNQEALIQYLERGTRGAHLRVINSADELLEDVSVEVASTPYRTVTYDTGVVHKPTLTGRQTLTVAAPGYEPQTFDIEASSFAGELQEVMLEASAD